jgi:hypothetical protein
VRATESCWKMETRKGFCDRIGIVENSWWILWAGPESQQFYSLDWRSRYSQTVVMELTIRAHGNECWLPKKLGKFLQSFSYFAEQHNVRVIMRRHCWLSSWLLERSSKNERKQCNSNYQINNPYPSYFTQRQFTWTVKLLINEWNRLKDMTNHETNAFPIETYV